VQTRNIDGPAAGADEIIKFIAAYITSYEAMLRFENAYEETALPCRLRPASHRAAILALLNENNT
jgi:hypothetical protein